MRYKVVHSFVARVRVVLSSSSSLLFTNCLFERPVPALCPGKFLAVSFCSSNRRAICVTSQVCRKSNKGGIMSHETNQQNNGKVNKCTVLKQETIHRAKWLSLERVTYRNPDGEEKTWESVERTTKPSTGGADAVAIIAILNRLLHYDCLVLVKQFRPALKCYTIEFPAGLIDAGETSETAALRELKEETGFTGTVLNVAPATALDPGVSASTVRFVHVQIDGNDSVNSHLPADSHTEEFIEVLLVPVQNLMSRISGWAKDQDVVIDARVYMYAATLMNPHLGMVSNTGLPHNS